MSVSTNQLASRILRLRLPKVCVCLSAAEASDLFYQADLQVRENTFLEFRLDYLKNPLSALPGLKRFFEYRPDAIGIAVCRRAAHGGKFRGSLSAEIDVLSKAAGAGCQIVDLGLESAEALKAADFDRLHETASLLLSFHDFKRSKDLDKTLGRMTAFSADFYKLATTATSLHDNVEMLNFLQRHKDDHALLGMCMGEQGLMSRVLCVRAGAAFTFAAPNRGEPTAEGQIGAREMQEMYRVDQLDAATRIYGVAANPVRHSLSPALINTAMRRENVNAVYLPLKVESLEDLLACVRQVPIHGLSVTMPFKEQILPLLDRTEQLTAATGSCNTVVRSQDGQLIGFNTDIQGILAPLEARLSSFGHRGVGDRRGRRGPLSGLWAQATGRQSVHPESHPGQRTEAGAAVRSQYREARRSRKDAVCSGDQYHSRWNGRLGRIAAQRKGAEVGAVRLRHGLQPGRHTVAADGASPGYSGHQRRGDVCASGGAAVRDLDREACSGGGNACGGAAPVGNSRAAHNLADSAPAG